jgi:hypothetical protein
LSDQSFKKILINTIPHRPSKKWDFLGHNVPSVDTFSGEKIKQLPYVVIPSKPINNLSCKGQYTFIGNGCGIGLQGQKLTYKGAWDSF